MISIPWNEQTLNLMTTARSIHPFRHFSHVLGIVSCLSMAPCVTAQVKSAPVAPEQAEVNPLPGSHGWANFTTVERDQFNLTDEQLTQLRDMDTKLAPQYNALGIEPWTNEKFPELNQKRDKAIRDILTAEQYAQWSDPSGKVIPVTSPTLTPSEDGSK